MLKHEELKTILKNLGLNEIEANLYLNSFGLGPQPASIVAKRSGLKRTHSYSILENLCRKGIIKEFFTNGIRYFDICEPGSLLLIIERKKNELDINKIKLEKILPEISNMNGHKVSKPKVHYYQGTEGLKEIYEDTLNFPNTEILAIGDYNYYFPANNQEFRNWIDNYIQRRAAKNIFYNVIANKSSNSDIAFYNRKPEKRKMKILHGVLLPVEISIYSNKVALLYTHTDTFGVVIEDENIAGSFKNLHCALWTFLPDYS